MKTMKTIMIFVFCFGFAQVTFGQFDSVWTSWTTCENNPILDLGPTGSWEGVWQTFPVVIYHQDTLRMWYTGHDQPDYYHYRIGLATSTDGINWTKSLFNPVDLKVGDPGSWDDATVGQAAVIYDNNTYKMWYIGDDGAHYRLGYATSPDGIYWTKHPDPVLNLGSAGSWDDNHIGAAVVMIDTTKYKMWYSGHDGSIWRIGYATSDDGISWTKADSINPMLKEGNNASWDRNGVLSYSVTKIANIYHMLFRGYGSNETGYAFSADGLKWEKYVTPVLYKGSPGAWDDEGSYPSSVIPFNDKYMMFYHGFDGNTSRIGCAFPTATGIDRIKYNAFDYIVNQNYPNPFNPSTTIEFTLPRSEYTTLKIYSILGAEVATLVSDKLQAGLHKYTFDGSNLASGVYYYQVTAGEFRDVRKMILLR